MRTSTSLTSVLLLLAGCGGGGDGGASSAPPTSAGDVYEVVASADRRTSPGAVLAFVTGAHVLVLDGDAAWLGQTRVTVTRGANDARTLALPGGLTADLTPAGDAWELTFSSGERIAMRKRTN